MKKFKQALQESGFTLTAELLLQAASSGTEILNQAKLLRDSVSAIQLSPHPRSAVSLSVVAAAGLLVRNGFDAIPRLHCRDRNRIALCSDLLGLRALGVTSLVLTGQSLAGHEPESGAKMVSEVSGNELTAMANAMNDEENTIPAMEFLIGTGARVFSPPPDWEPGLLRARASAGARFLLTQPCFDLNVLSQYMQRLVETKLTWNYSVIVSLAPLPSAEMALSLRNDDHGWLIPPAILERLKSAANPEAEGIAICAELMRRVAAIPGVSGINLLTLGNPDRVLGTIVESGLGERPA